MSIQENASALALSTLQLEIVFMSRSGAVSKELMRKSKWLSVPLFPGNETLGEKRILLETNHELTSSRKSFLTKFRAVKKISFTANIACRS